MLESSSCRQGRLGIPCSRFPDGAANGALETSPLFQVIRSLRSSTGEKTLFRLTALFSSESGEGDGDAAKSVDAKAVEEAEYASTGAEAEEAKASSAIVPTIPRPEDHLKVMVVPLPHWPLFPGFYMPDSIKDSKLLSALAGNCYASAFFFKDEPGIDPSLVSSTETRKSIYEIKGQELFNRLRDIGTLADQKSSIQGNEVYLPYHCRLQKMEMVEVEECINLLCDRKGPLKLKEKFYKMADSKLLLALAGNCYAGAFFFKDEPGTNPSMVSSIETGKSIYEIKGQELFNCIHDIGTLADQDSKLLSALAGNCYTCAFLFKDEPGIDPSLVSSTETRKSIYEFMGQELFNRLHDIGTFADQKSSIQGNEVYLLCHRHLQKMEMVEVEECINLCDRKEPLKLKRKFYKMACRFSLCLLQYFIEESKLLSALAGNCYAGAFLFKDEPGTNSSLVSDTETGKSIYEFKSQELFNRLHDIGTMADQELPNNKDDDVEKATYFKVISALRDVLKISSVWREYAKTYSRYIGYFTYGRLAYFGAALSMANKLLCQQVLEELDVHRRLKLTLDLIKKEIEINKIQESIAKAVEEKISGEQ